MTGHAGAPGSRRRRAGTAGLLGLAGAIMLGVWGIVSRDRSEARLTTWTEAQAIPDVRVVRPAPLQGGREFVLPGTVQAFYEAPIYARVSGYVASWRADIGARVHRGDVLAVIDAPELDQQLNHARAALASAQSDEKLASLTARRWRALLASKSVAEQTVDEKVAAADAKQDVVRAAQAEVDQLAALARFKIITAPFDGVVTARNTDVGALIDAGSGRGLQLFRVADLHEMRVYVPVPQSQSAAIPIGASASLTVSQYPDQTFAAKVATTANAVNEQSRTVLFELLAPNPRGQLLPGTYAQVHFKLAPEPGRLDIPASAVIFQEDGTELALLRPDGTVTLQRVVLGRNDGTSVEVVSGLAAQDAVIDSPPDSLVTGDRVNVAARRGGQDRVAVETPRSP